MFSLFGKKTPQETSPIEKTEKPLEDFTDVDPFAQYFYKETGITFEKQKAILKSKLRSFCKNHNIYSFQNCLEQIKTNTGLKREIINYLTTNESYFYREFHQIKELIDKISLSTGQVNILCAPCSTGEEPYSIAIALSEAGIETHRFSICAIDINSEAVEHAIAGYYNSRSISKMPSNLKEKYFKQVEDKFLLRQEIKSTTTFKVTKIRKIIFFVYGQGLRWRPQ